MSKKKWSNPKFPGEWHGTNTATNVKGYWERAFNLFRYAVDKKTEKVITVKDHDGKKRKVVGKVRTYESWQAAVLDGWSRE